MSTLKPAVMKAHREREKRRLLKKAKTADAERIAAEMSPLAGDPPLLKSTQVVATAKKWGDKISKRTKYGLALGATAGLGELGYEGVQK